MHHWHPYLDAWRYRPSVFRHWRCALCAHAFDDDQRTPRIVKCGHTFCAACIGARTTQENPHKWSFQCPVPGCESTSVRRGEVTYLPRHDAVEFDLPTAPLFIAHVKNLAGGVVARLLVNAYNNVEEIKSLLYQVDNNMFVERRQQLMIKNEFYEEDSPAADSAHALPWKNFGPRGDGTDWRANRETLADNNIDGEFEMWVVMCDAGDTDSESASDEDDDVDS
jgi:hypothetical protein